nr:immunoglobulin heavy chain junction region [Mus musculus]
CTHYFDYW